MRRFWRRLVPIPSPSKSIGALKDALRLAVSADEVRAGIPGPVGWVLRTVLQASAPAPPGAAHLGLWRRSPLKRSSRTHRAL
jgi:hypothetical protein